MHHVRSLHYAPVAQKPEHTEFGEGLTGGRSPLDRSRLSVKHIRFITEKLWASASSGTDYFPVHMYIHSDSLIC
jgi:hypothetical protein